MAAEQLSTQDPITLIWIKQQFDKLHREHVVIIDKLNEIHREVEQMPRLISPELEKAINRARGLSIKIDRQVPDSKPTPNRRTT